MSNNLSFNPNTKMSLPIITLTSSSKTTISESYPSLISTKNLREPSFSSYLTGADETFVLKLRNTISTEEETKKEIDVFDAKRYFSDLISTKSLPNQIKLQKDDPIETVPISVYSESSSNIRGPLLHAVSRTSKKIKFLTSIGCINCSCRDSNSVKIESVFKGGNRKSREDQVKKSAKSDEVLINPDEQYFSFPIFNPKSDQNGTKNSNVLSVEKKPDMWSWEEISPGETTKKPSLFSNEIDNYDSDSDASSDLFEIKSITPSANSLCYAQSEASSVEWSVVTESAADFSSPAAPDDRKVGQNSENGKNVPMKETGKRRCRRILSGCKNEKSVGVAASVTPITTRVHARNRQQINYDACHVVSEPHRRSDERLLDT